MTLMPQTMTSMEGKTELTDALPGRGEADVINGNVTVVSGPSHSLKAKLEGTDKSPIHGSVQ